MDDVRAAFRHAVLVDAIIEPVDLDQIDWQAKQHLPSVSLSERQGEVIDVIRSLVADGLVESGHIAKNDGFTVVPIEDFVRDIRDTYIADHDELGMWIWSFHLKLTDEGWKVATSTPEGRRVAQHERERIEGNRTAFGVHPPNAQQ